MGVQPITPFGEELEAPQNHNMQEQHIGTGSASSAASGAGGKTKIKSPAWWGALLAILFYCVPILKLSFSGVYCGLSIAICSTAALIYIPLGLWAKSWSRVGSVAVLSYHVLVTHFLMFGFGAFANLIMLIPTFRMIQGVHGAFVQARNRQMPDLRGEHQARRREQTRTEAIMAPIKRIVLSVLACVVPLLPLAIYSRGCAGRFYDGDGEFIRLGAGNHWKINIGTVDLSEEGNYSFRLGNLPHGKPHTVGLLMDPALDYTEYRRVSELKTKLKTIVVEMTLTAEDGETVFTQHAPLREWQWNRGGSHPGVLLQRSGEAGWAAKNRPGGPLHGSGTGFIPRRWHKYVLTIGVTNPLPDAPLVRVRAHAGGL